MHGVAWQFLRMRPANFPTLKIVQLASVYAAVAPIWGRVLANPEQKNLTELFTPEVSDYWFNHYLTDKPGRRVPRGLSNAFIQQLILNAVVPVLFSYGKFKSSPQLIQQALSTLESVLPEQNRITQLWKKNGINPINGLHSQGMLQQTYSMCQFTRCTECGIGTNLLKSYI